MAGNHNKLFVRRASPKPRIMHRCLSCAKSFSIKVSNVARGYGKYCSRACRTAGRGEGTRGQFSPAFRRKFFARVQHCPHDIWCLYCCWPWLGRHITVAGYGTIIIQGKTRYAHRIAWELHHGASLAETHPHDVIRHLCHTRNCVNPSHLTHGTPYQNTHDTMDAGRMPVGESHHKSKLTADNVQELRLLREAGWTYQALADRYNVAEMTIFSCCNRKSWKHV